MKLAITHDYLIDYGGAERVLESLHEIFPDASVFVSIYDKKKLGEFSKDFEKMDIRVSWFDYLPFASKLTSPLRFLLPLVWGSFDLSDFDVIIDSSSWAITRGFKTRKEQVEVCYCHTPPRYLYGYDTSRNWKNKWYGSFIDLYALIVNHFMRLYDWSTSQKVDYFIANSENVSKRIEKFYRRESKVIYPPVDVKKIIDSKVPEGEKDYFLTGGRLVAAKNFDLIIRACKELKVKLKIFGTGILEGELKKISENSVEFLGKISDEELIVYYKNAKGFIVAQTDEDFGITTVESQAAGTPVIAYKGGGYLETIVEGRTGVFFNELKVESLTHAINKFKKIKWSKKVIENNAKKFSKENFKKEILKFIKEKYARVTRS